MNQHLQDILTIIQQDEYLSAEQRTAISKSIKEADKELEITAFKLDRTEKVKRTTAILLEETIEELEQKRKAVEAQNRELEIETALERVRTVAMAMRKPADLLDICKIVYSELQSLGFIELRNAMINIHNDDKSSLLNYDYSDNFGQTVTDIPYNFHPLVEKQVAVTKNAQDAFFEFSFTGEELKQFRELRKNNGEQDDPKLEITDALHYYFFSIGTGSIGISTYSAISEKKLELLKRFRNVFNLSYQRYIDISLAEAQAKEARIETALERVRAVAMAMKKSDELITVCEVMYRELQALGFTNIRNGQIAINLNSYKEWLIFEYSEYGQINMKKVDNTVSPLLQEIAILMSKSKDALFQKQLSSKEFKAWRNWRVKEDGLKDPRLEKANSICFYLYAVESGILGISTFDEITSEQLEILKRFKNVFELSYRRYADVAQAEAQAREAEIELALERVRSKSMAMHNSSELAEVAVLLFEQARHLGIDSFSSGFNIWNNDHKNLVSWMSNATGHLNPPFELPIQAYEQHKRIYASWKNNESFIEDDLIGEALTKHYQFLRSFPLLDDSFKIAEQAGIKIPERQVHNIVIFSHGYLLFIAHEPCPHFHPIFIRFAKVFEQTYIRFLDLQKAEAQAREAKIETGLERVRSRSMAMHNTSELQEVINTVHKELLNLNIAIHGGSFITINSDIETVLRCWGSGGTADTSEEVHIPLYEKPFCTNLINSIKNGPGFFTEEYTQQEKKKFFTFLFKHEPWSKLDAKQKKETLSNLGGYTRSCCVSQHTSIFIINHFGEKFSEADNDILIRFAKVFEQTYTRFLDLQKAEAQLREAQIEAALERVRSRSMGMQKSEELKEVIKIVYQQLTHLKIKLDHAGFVVDYTPGGDWHFWIADEQVIPSKITHPYFESIWVNQFNEAKENARLPDGQAAGFFTTNLNFDEKNKFYNELLSYVPGLPETSKDYYLSCPGLAASTVLFDNVSLYIENFSGIPYTNEQNKILMRFGKVFQQTYTRFLDLQKAEAQAREAQIELGLERVRARAMSMQNSDELNELVGSVFTELTKLDLVLTRCLILIYEGIEKGVRWWMANSEAPSTPMNFFVKYADMPFFNEYIKGWQDRSLKWQYILDGENKIKLDDFVFNETELSKMPSFVIEGMRAPDRVYLNASFNNFGNLTLASLEPLSNEHFDILLRFAKVFDLTYTRFNDLKQAEAQARESQIQLSLERVRARTMAMQRSDELQDAASLMVQQIQTLGVPQFGSGFNIWDDDRKAATAWMCNVTTDDLPPPFKTSSAEDIFLLIHDAAQRGELLFVKEQAGEELKTHYWYMNSIPIFREYVERASPEGLSIPDFQIMHCAFFSQGYLMFITYEPVPESHDIFKRFAKVFEQTYTRFLDLQKAEAQARAATIEAALEKVRGKAMGMHNSDDLSVTASLVFTELRKLGINSIRSGVGLLNKENRKVILYAATSADDGDHLSLVGWAMLQDHPVLSEIYDSWIRHEDYFPVLKGKLLKTYCEKILSSFEVPGSHYQKNLPDNALTETNSNYEQHGHFLAFSEGFLYGWSEKPYTEKEIKILNRFKTIIDLTFRRYIELQKSEANAREAEKQAALDRVRAEIASMRTINDLDRITPLIWNELTILGVAFIRCGVFIMDDANEIIHTFLSTPEGKAIAAFQIPYTTPGNIEIVLSHWQHKKNYIDHWDESDFTEFSGTLIKEGALLSPEEYLETIPRGGFYLHFLPFLQGMLYVGNTTQLDEEEIKLIQSVADAFSTAYARYEDFNKLEAAKQQVDKTLVDLKQAQAQLVQSEKMASLGELTAGIAHEIQNPLNFVNNFSEVNKELLTELNEEIEKGNYEDVKAIAKDVIDNEEKINHHGKRAGDIVKGMLQHSRTSTGKKEPTDINALADEYLRLSYHGLRAKDKSFNADFKTDFDNSIGKINIIPQDIGRVLLNLINNAFYAVDERQKITKENLPTGQAGYQPTVFLSSKKNGDKVILTVKDNGSGIPQNIVDKIFQPFFTTKPTGQGTGLGLSLSYDIVKAHGGEIKVETKEREGTEFIIQLPVVSITD
jgi:signal transduction histidine kinase/DNA-directed RNA polymerase subunit N (RpoN/RPB10)